MADREVTTRFRADVSDFKANVKAMNSEMKLANSEFKAATAGMDDWRKSTEGIQAKLKQLNTNLTAQKSVLQSLEQQYQQVVAAQGADSAAALRLETQLNNQRAAVAATEREIRNYEQSLEDLNDTSEQYEATNQVLSETFGTLAKAGAAAFAAIGAAAAAGLAKVLSGSNEAQKAMNSFAAETGTTTEELGEYTDAMENIYKANFGESFEDIAASMGEIKQQMGDLGADELENMTKKALALRDTFEFDVAESTRAASSLMDQFGISADEAYNLIAQGAQTGLNKNGDLLDVVNEYAVQFADTGLSAEDMFNMIANGASEGVWSVDKMGDAFKEFNIRMSDGTANEYLESIGLNADDVTSKFAKGGDSAKEAMSQIAEALLNVEDPTAQYSAGVGLMGTMFEDMGIDAVTSLLNTEGAITTTKDSLEEINAIKYNDIGSAIEGIKRNLEIGLLKPIGDAILPKVNELAAKFQEWLANPENQKAIQDLSTKLVDFAENALTKVLDAAEWFLDNKDLIIAGLAGIAAGFLAFKVVSIIQSVKTAMEGMTIAQYALNLAMSLNPVGLVVAAIAGLVAAFVVLWNKSDTFRQFWLDLWEKIKDAASAAGEWISEKFAAIGDFFSNLGSSISGFFDKTKTAVSEKFTAIKNTMGNIMGAAKDVVSEKLNNIQSAYEKNGGGLKGTAAAVWEGLKGYWTAGFDFVNNLTNGKLNGIKNTFTNIFNNIKTFISSTWTNIKTNFSNALSAVSSNVTNSFNTVKNTITNVLNTIRNTVSNIFNSIKSTVSNVTNSIKSTVSNIFNSIKNTISNIMNGASNAVSNAINSIKNKFNFSWSLPKLKLPHISISGSFSINPPRVPSFGISWYAKGGLMDGATLFGMNKNNLAVGGEAGKEAILPLENNTGGWANLLATVLLKELNKITNLNGISDIAKQLTASLDQSNNTLVNNLARQMQNYQTALVAAMQNVQKGGPIGAPQYTIHQTITNTKTSQYEIYRATRNAVTLFN